MHIDPFKNIKNSTKQRTGVMNVTTGYKPRPQQEFIHRSLVRFNVLVCHRRMGKTVLAINEMIDKALRNKRHNPQYAYIAPTYKQAKMIAWEYIIDYTRNIPGVEANKSELTVTIHRPAVMKDGVEAKRADKIKFILLGAENPDSIRGIYLDGVILDEYAQCDPSIWGEVVLPTLADRVGWAIFIGTPKGQNHFFDIYQKAQKDPNWFASMFKASETGLLSKDELGIMRSATTQEEYDQEFECSFTAALIGSYYGEIINRMMAEVPTRITRITYNPNFPVDTFWDIGVGDDCTIVFRQKVAGTYYYIDYYKNNRKGLPHYVEVLQGKGYLYGRHVFPHDGRVQEFGTGLTRVEQARDLGLVVEVQKRQAVDDRINAARTRLTQSYISEDKCDEMLKCLKNYEREYDAKNKVFKKSPKHNWASHGADVFGYSALDAEDSSFSGEKRKDLPDKADTEYNIFG